ncbi:hypothetical protein IWX49DRAFT_556102 [Phyllosticta citricarpa]|uniref:MARVEL domain-containing protein n=2 Tax=Phyllosticta TaxID=121621 RepID=A0ABR1MF85_9PEZI
MGLSGFFFICFRLAEIITLIPIIGMLSWFVHGYVEQNALTPDFILVLFIVSVLACAWAIATLVAYARARHSALFVATVDLAFLGALIAGVVLLRGIADQDCVNFSAGSFYLDLGVLGYYGRNTNSEWSLHANKACAMLKASFAFGIMNCVFFFFTFLFALLVHRRYRDDDRVVVRRTYHTTRRSHRPSREYAYSSSPRRSHHSSRARYHV